MRNRNKNKNIQMTKHSFNNNNNKASSACFAAPINPWSCRWCHQSSVELPSSCTTQRNMFDVLPKRHVIRRSSGWWWWLRLYKARSLRSRAVIAAKPCLRWTTGYDQAAWFQLRNELLLQNTIVSWDSLAQRFQIRRPSFSCGTR
jgi:hypothetical protein